MSMHLQLQQEGNSRYQKPTPGASPFCFGSGGGWHHVCGVQILTQLYFFFRKCSQEKKKLIFFLSSFLFTFFPTLKLFWDQLLFLLPHSQTFQVRRNSLFGGLLEKLFTSINRAYSSWFYLSPFYCFRLLFILADTSMGTFQRRESKVTQKCIWTTSRKKSKIWW